MQGILADSWDRNSEPTSMRDDKNRTKQTRIDGTVNLRKRPVKREHLQSTEQTGLGDESKLRASPIATIAVRFINKNGSVLLIRRYNSDVKHASEFPAPGQQQSH
jgi:hypothetical protein